MKELSIQEKAKAYDEAIERYKAKQEYESQKVHEFIEYLFPELKKSEDEKIKKAILELVRQSSEILEKKNQEQMIAWLEKQGKNNMGISEATKKKLEDNLNKALEKETPESFNKFLDEQGEQKPADKVEPKFKIGDKVHLINGSSPNYEDDCIVISDISNNTYYGNWEGGYFAIKDQDKYELVEQKPAWSEEDEKNLQTIQINVDRCIGKWNGYGEVCPISKCMPWLRSLRPQKKEALPQWRRLPLSDVSYAPDSWCVMNVITSTVGGNSASVPALVKGDYYVPLFELEKFIRNI